MIGFVVSLLPTTVLLLLISATDLIYGQWSYDSYSTRCYTCSSNDRGYERGVNADYDQCRNMQPYDQQFWSKPPAYSCPSGSCIKMDVVIRNDLYPRVYRFCDYNRLVSASIGDPYSGTLGGTSLREGECQNNINVKLIEPALRSISNVYRNYIGSRGIGLGASSPIGANPVGLNRYDPYLNERRRFRRAAHDQHKLKRIVKRQSIAPFNLDSIIYNDVSGIRVCRCDWDVCNAAALKNVNFVVTTFCVLPVIVVAVFK